MAYLYKESFTIQLFGLIFVCSLYLSAVKCSAGDDLYSEHWRKLSEEDKNLKPLNMTKLKLIAEDGSDIKISISVVDKKMMLFVDDAEVYIKDVDNSAGFHVIALHPEYGDVMLKRHFKTGELAEGELLATCLASMQPGTIVVLIPFFDAGDYLGMTERFLLYQFGMKGYGVGGGVFPGYTFPEILDIQTSQQQQQHPSSKTEDGISMKLGSGHFAAKVMTSRVYVNVDDPVAVISKVPAGWPPQSLQDILTSTVYAESAIINRPFRSKIANIEISTGVKKELRQSCSWHSDERRAKQRQFCNTYEGYGALCRCRHPINPNKLRHSAAKINQEEVIPVAILTATKPYFFYRLLVNLLVTPGAAQTPILVFTDGFQRETSLLAHLFGLPIHIHNHEGGIESYTPLNSHLKFSVYNSFYLYQNISKVIFLEDDLILSPDFLSYFHQTAWLLDADPSIYCINSFSTNSYREVASDPTRIRRSDMYPQYGWMVTRQWVQEIIPLWVDSKATSSDWDWWLYGQARRKNRQVILPEVSRILHSGSSGVHVTGWEQAMLYSQMTYNLEFNVKLKDLHLLTEFTYEDHMRTEMKRGFKLPETFHPCDLTTLPHDIPAEVPLVFVVDASSQSDEKGSFVTVARCLHGFPSDARDMYRGVVQYRVGGLKRLLYVVGCPMSLFCVDLIGTYPNGPHPDGVLSIREKDDSRRMMLAIFKLRDIKIFKNTDIHY